MTLEPYLSAPTSAPSIPPLTFTTVPASSADAQACQAAYFAELSARFKEGFDMSHYAGTHTPTEAANGTDNGDSKDEEDEDSAQFEAPRGVFVLAYLGSDLAGCGGVRLLEPGIAEIKRMWVSPAARGKRVASRLLTRLEALGVSDLQANMLRLDTKDVLHEAIKLYVSRGYYEIPRYNDNPYATHFYEKKM